MLVGAVSVYAYDSARSDRMARGVRVAGVPVGGLTAAKARDKVRRALARKLERPVVVRAGGRRFTLSAADAGVRADVGGMVDRALSESRAGGMLERVFRDVTGGRKATDVPARVSYSRPAVSGLVARVARGVDRRARDATVGFPSLDPVKERDGVAVQRPALERRVQAALLAGGRRSFAAPVRRTRPAVTTTQLARKYPTVVIVDRSAFRLKLYRDLKLKKTYTIAVGMVGLETPAGLYHIQNKGVNVPWNVPNRAWAGDLAGKTIPAGSPDNPIKARWLGIFDGAGIHGTDETASLGQAVSHGCVRMSIPDVIELYPQVPVGAPIYIE